MRECEMTCRGWRHVWWAVLVGFLALGSSAAQAQNIFNQSSPSPGPFTSKYFGETIAGGIPAQCGGSLYIYSTGVSAGGLVVGGMGSFCEQPVFVFDKETPYVWSPNFGNGGLGSGAPVPLNLPAQFTDFASGTATGIDAAGKNVVGVVLGSTSGEAPFYHILPYIWQAPTAGGFAGVTPTQLSLLAGDTDGAAYGISANGKYATGWSGQVNFSVFFPVPDSSSTMQAVIWNVATNTATSLGPTPDPVNSPASVGKAVAGNGTVVGWFGNFPPGGFTNDINLDTGSAELLSASSTLDFSTQHQPKPFVWTMAGGTITQLGMTPMNNSSTTYLYGEGRALNADGSSTASVGTVAVGWLGNSKTQFEAVCWATTDNWVTSSTLQLATIQPDDPASTGRIGSVANAVDASGLNAVGRVEYSCVGGNGGVCSQAVYWSVAADGTSSSGATLAAILASVGISTSNVTLTDATGIIVVAHSPPENILIVGNGFRDDFTPDVFLIRLQRPDPTAPTTPTTPTAAITSLLEQERSIAGLGVIANQFIAATDAAMAGLATAADYYRCQRPKGPDPAQGWCGFAFGLARSNGGYDNNGNDYTGNFGIARYFTPATSVGVSVGASGLNNGLAYGGNFNAAGATFGTYFSHRPDLGLQFLAQGVASFYPELNVSRGYPNGAAALASSQGTTQSWTGGASARLGWSLPVFSTALIATPFAQVSYIKSHIDGWIENGGPFPAAIGGFDGITTVVRVGSQWRAAISDKVTLFGSAAWADTVQSRAPIVQGSLIVADCGGATPILGFCGIGGTGPAMPKQWAEGSAGVRVELSPVSVATVNAILASLNGVTYGAQVGYSHAF